MKIETRDFGEMEIDPEEVVEFLSPIYGFENLRRFVLLYDDKIPPLLGSIHRRTSGVFYYGGSCYCG